MNYQDLLSAVRNGRLPALADAQAILVSAGKTSEEFLTDLFVNAPPVRTGAPCPRCGSRFKVLNSRLLAGRRVRYVGCGRCGFRPLGNKQVSKVCATNATMGPVRHFQIPTTR